MVHTYPAVSVWSRPSLLPLKALFYKGINYNSRRQYYVQKWCELIVNSEAYLLYFWLL